METEVKTLNQGLCHFPTLSYIKSYDKVAAECNYLKSCTVFWST